jgi:hypothetical protein
MSQKARCLHQNHYFPSTMPASDIAAWWRTLNAAKGTKEKPTTKLEKSRPHQARLDPFVRFFVSGLFSKRFLIQT